MPLVVRRAERRNRGGRRAFICSCSNGFSARDCVGPRRHTVKGVGEERVKGPGVAAGRGEKAAEDRGPDIRVGAQGRGRGPKDMPAPWAAPGWACWAEGRALEAERKERELREGFPGSAKYSSFPQMEAAGAR